VLDLPCQKGPGIRHAKSAPISEVGDLSSDVELGSFCNAVLPKTGTRKAIPAPTKAGQDRP
jgi:hypothetical protein